MDVWQQKVAVTQFQYKADQDVYKRQGYVEKEEINPKKVIFEAYMGKKYACSPKALYQAMCRDPQYQDCLLYTSRCV